MNDGQPKLLWEPSAERIRRATITRYAEWLQRTRGLRFDDYAALWEWSVGNLDEFWATIVEFFEVDFAVAPQAILGRREMPGTEWFPGAKVSFAEHIFRGKRDDDVAIRHASELRELGSWTWGELRSPDGADRRRAARARTSASGDRVVAYLPNIPETVAAFLACASIGAIWSSAAPEFGARSVVDRFAQIEPKVLLAVDGYRYGGKDFDRERDRRRDRAPSCRRSSASCGSGTWTGAVGRRAFCAAARRRAGVRAVAVRPPAVGALQLGHDRPAEADRPRPGRDPASSSSRR